MPKKDTKLQKLSESIQYTVEEIRNLGIEDLDSQFFDSYLDQAAQLTDSRQQAKVQHSLKDIIGIVFFAVLAGNDEWIDIAEFAVDERATLKKYLELPNGIPSHDTIQRLFFLLNGEELQKMLVDILIQLVSVAGKGIDEFLYQNEELGCCIRDVIAADGKETCNSGNARKKDPCEKRNLNEFNVMSTEWRLSLSSTRIDEKSNEIPEMQKVIKTLDCSGCVVTTDALNTQRETAKTIVDDANGDYCLALKGNQKTAYEEVKLYFSSKEILEEIQEKKEQYLKETQNTTYQLITREYYITDTINWFEDRKEWKKLTSFGYEKKTIQKKDTGETSIEERYFLCSIPPLAELFAIVVRRHWHIENNLHWTLDIVFREDKLRSKEKNGIHNLGLIRRFVMFLLKLLKNYYHRSLKGIRTKIGRNLESELPVVLAVLKVLYDKDLFDSIDELTK